MPKELTEKEKRLIKVALTNLNGKDSSVLLAKELNKVDTKVEKVREVLMAFVDSVDLDAKKGDVGERGEKGESIKGEKGDKGDFVKGDKGEKGESIKGKDGKDGKDAVVDVEEITGEVLNKMPEPVVLDDPPKIRNKLESLVDNERLDIKAIKGFDETIDEIKRAEKDGRQAILSNFRNRTGTDGFNLKVDDAKIGRVNHLNLKAGTHATLAHDPAFGANDVTFNVDESSLDTLYLRLDGTSTMAGNIVMGDNSVTGIDTLTFTDVNGTIAGIQNQNLLDKTAAENISGAYTLTTGDLTINDDIKLDFGTGGVSQMYYDSVNAVLRVDGDILQIGNLTIFGAAPPPQLVLLDFTVMTWTILNDNTDLSFTPSTIAKANRIVADSPISIGVDYWNANLGARDGLLFDASYTKSFNNFGAFVCFAPTITNTNNTFLDLGFDYSLNLTHENASAIGDLTVFIDNSTQKRTDVGPLFQHESFVDKSIVSGSVGAATLTTKRSFYAQPSIVPTNIGFVTVSNYDGFLSSAILTTPAGTTAEFTTFRAFRAMGFGISAGSNTTIGTYTGFQIDDIKPSSGAIDTFTNWRGIWIADQTGGATNKWGIVLDSDDADGGAIWFGNAQDGKMYHDGSALNIQSDVVGAGNALNLRGGTNGIVMNIGATTEVTIDTNEMTFNNGASDTALNWGISGLLIFKVGGDNQMTLLDGALASTVDGDVDLGISNFRWKDGYFLGNISLYEAAEMRFYDVGSSHYVGFEAPALTATQIWVLPTADGNANEVMKTDGSGNLDFGGMKDVGAVHPVGHYISGSGTAGSDNTAQTVQTITLPANCLSQNGDRVRVRCYWTGDTGAAITGSNTTNGVACASVTDSGAATFQVTEYWLHYIDSTHANIISMAGGTINTTLSAANVAGFDFTIDQDLDVDQDAIVNNHIVVYFFAADVFPKGAAL